jgi:malate dehydrogenase (oxaloacetate-decarboxylating)(NADP+)
MVTGLTRSFAVCFNEVTRVLTAPAANDVFGLTAVIARSQTVFIADTAVHELPSSEELANIAEQSAVAARRLGHEPRVAMLSFSNFGNPSLDTAERMREAVRILDGRAVDFEYDGEMSADVALDADLMKSAYPFCRLSGAANVLVMPSLHAANISAKLLQKLGGGTVIGPVLIGLPQAAQIVQMGATVSELVNMAAFAAHDALSAESD